MKRTDKHPIKDHVVVLKLQGSLVEALDLAARAEGLTRSAIIRRALLEKYVGPKRLA